MLRPNPRQVSSRRARLLLPLLAALLPSAASAAAQQTSDEERAWNEPVEPFRVAGNVYYVGATEVASYLITTPEGHFVLDGGLPQTAPQILSNIERLGFDPADVELLLNSHAHYDHAGGLAELEARTGAAILLSAGDVDQARRGGLGDFAFGDRFAFPAFAPDRVVADGEAVTLGGVTMTAHVTPGHTRGCTTWTLRVVEAGEPLDVLFLCSVTAPGYRLIGNAAYPEILEDYRATFRRLEAMDADVFLANHGSFFDLHAKRAQLAATPARNPFVDPDGYRRHLARMKEELERKAKEQRSGEAPKPGAAR